MDRQWQTLRGASSIICDETDVAAVWAMWLCLLLIVHVPEKESMDSEKESMDSEFKSVVEMKP